MAFRTSAMEGLLFDPALGVNQASLGGGEETAFISVLRSRGGDVIWVPEMRVRHYVDPARMELGYLIRLARDRGRSSIRHKGIPKGIRVAGAPARLWMQMARAGLLTAFSYGTGQRIRSAGHFAKFESYRAKIAECWKVARVAR